MVMASDQCECDGAALGPGGLTVKNLLRKIAISGEFAWAFSDGKLGPFFPPFLQRALDSAGTVTCERAVQILEGCGSPALAEWTKHVADGPAGKSRIVLACGKSRRIFRADISPNMKALEIMEGKCVSGNYYNLAAFIPTRFHGTGASVDFLAQLAAYSIQVAHEIDTQRVDGLDVAVFRDSLGRFEFEDAVARRNCVVDIEREMRDCFVRAPQLPRSDP